jgi:hypothetical protein
MDLPETVKYQNKGDTGFCCSLNRRKKAGIQNSQNDGLYLQFYLQEDKKQ